jgi:hypothetical protein
MGTANVSRVIFSGFFSLVIGSGLLSGQITGGMLNPAIDPPGKPFSYFWHPTDVIGALYDPIASEVTPEGYIYTGFGELMFFMGNPPEPLNQRIKTLYQGYLPIVQYDFVRNGVHYNFTIFAADLGGRLQGLPVNFIRVRLQNRDRVQRTAFLSSAWRHIAPNNRFDGRLDYRFAQRFDLVPKQYTEGQTTFSPNWQYSLSSDALLRDGRILYLFPTNPEPEEVSLCLGDRGFHLFRFLSGEIQGNPIPTCRADAYTPVGAITYRLTLKPGQAMRLTYKMPIAPLPGNSGAARQIREADFSGNFQKTVAFWEGLVAKAPPLRFPEAKVQQTLLANTIFDLLAIDKVGTDTIPNVNKFQYHRYYPTDTALMNVALDDMGLENIARECMLYALKYQKPDGSLMQVNSPNLYESFGHVLWSWGRHYLLTRDDAFLHQVYPGVLKAMDWEMRITRTDPLGLIPAATVHDDAQLKNCHQTGQDIWTLIGLKNAIALAEGMRRSQDVERFTAEYQRFWNAFQKQLSVQTAKTGGYIPPSLDRTLAGNDWDNLHTLYPEPLFEPFDPRVTATIRKTRATYVEGILPYVDPMAIAKKPGGYVFQSERTLHYWHTPDNSENQLVRDDPKDQQLTVNDLYALLLHTSSTHATQEWGAYPWSTRDYAYPGNILPDGSTSATIIELLRNMVVREYKNELFLFSAISPAWLQPGKSVEVVNEPTVFGPVTAILRADSDGWKVELSNQFRQPPKNIVVRIPWFYEPRQAYADGRPIKITDGQLVLSANVRRVRVSGKIKLGTPEMSYERAVRDYKAEYAERYQTFQRTGSIN